MTPQGRGAPAPPARGSPAGCGGSWPPPRARAPPRMGAPAALHPSLARPPVLNARGGGIPPPGARHRSGGHQELTTPLPGARAVAAAPNGAQVWSALLDHLAPDLSEPDPALQL